MNDDVMEAEIVIDESRKGGIKRETLRTRYKRDGERWLSYFEARAFSEYAGYDLTAE